MPKRQRQRLTDRSIRSKKRGLHADGDGLMLAVTANESRSWILRTMVHGRRRDIGLGGLSTTSLSEAREKARQLRKIARAGGDPLEVRNKANTPVPLFREAAQIVHAEQSSSWKNEKHSAQWINTLEQYAFPTIGDTRVDAIRSEHIVKVIAPIWGTTSETARRVIQRIGSVLLWAKGNGHRTDSPRDEIAAARQALPRQKDRVRHHKSLRYEDVPSFLRKLRAFSTSDQIKLAFEFLILTATRTNEVLGAKWPEVDFAKKVWTIPESRMKANREHSVPLSHRCIEILEEARKLNDDPLGYVFPGTRPGKPLSDMVFLMALRRNDLDITAHGFRSSFRVWCAEKARYAREVAEAALAHVVKDATEAAYMRSTFFDLRRQMMTDWMEFATERPAGHKRQNRARL